MTPQFKAAVETYGARFMADLGLEAHQVAGIFGNLAVESDQFRALQEYNPTVKGSRGGWGWPQWTGPRRRQFEAWADKQGLKRDDPEGFYAYMLVELRGPEAAALKALKQTRTVEAAAESFMRRYERPGVPHLDRRKAFAREAMDLIGPAAQRAPAVVKKAPAARPAAEPVLPTAPTVEPPVVPTQLPWWQRALGIKPPALAIQRPGLAANGDPALWDIQDALSRLKYPVGLRDGLMGRNTRAAVSAARERNGLPEGNTIDAAFKAALPGMLPAEVSQQRAEAGKAELRQQAPEATRQLDGIGLVGKLIMGASGIGAADASGMLDTFKATADQATETLQSVQAVVNGLVGVIQWCVQHWWILGFVVGAYILARVAMAVLRLVVLLRQGRLL